VKTPDNGSLPLTGAAPENAEISFYFEPKGNEEKLQRKNAANSEA
jgi:hypothetical protein